MLFLIQRTQHESQNFSHICDNEIKAKQRKWTKCLDAGKKCGGRRVLAWPSPVTWPAAPTTYQLPATHPLVFIWIYTMDNRKTWIQVEWSWQWLAVFLRRQKTRMNQIIRKDKTLLQKKCKQLFLAPNYVPVCHYLHFVQFWFMFHWNTEPLVGGGQKVSGVGCNIIKKYGNFRFGSWNTNIEG